MTLKIILSVLPMFVAIYWIILLLNTRRKNLSKQFLAFFLSLSVINYFIHATYFNHDYELYGFLENIWIFTSLVAYPLYYYYLRLLTRDSKINWKWAWIIIPSTALSLFAFWLYFKMSPEELEAFIHGVLYNELGYAIESSRLIRLGVFRTELFKVIFGIQLVLSAYFGIRLISEYNHEVKEFYSDEKGKNLDQLKWVLYAFIFASVISLASSIIGKEYFIDKGIFLAIPSITHSLFLWFIGYVGYHQDFTVIEFEQDLKDYKLKHAESIFKKPTDFRGNMDAGDLEKMIEKEELFTNPEFRISDLAVRDATNRTYISRIINEDLNTNFSDWINGYRAEYAKEMLENKEVSNLSLIEIGERSGFSSQSAFYRVFKEKYDVAPGIYRKSQLKTKYV